MAAPQPAWLDKGDNAWQMTAATLVGLQSVPGLMVIYAGLVKSKWAVNSAFMGFYGFAATLICWVIWAYKESFGKHMLPFVGIPGPSLSMEFQMTQAILPTSGVTANYPMSTMIYFQFVFAAITVVITAGSLLARMNFVAWMLYVPLWITFSYSVSAYSIWGGGFLAKLGVIDYSGGYVIHLAGGTAGFVGAYWVGPRLDIDREDNRPNNIMSVLVGAGILWLGWNGFNGGDPYSANVDAGVAVINTNICTATSLLVWTLCDYGYFGKPSIIGAVNGMICGLVAITPAAGVIAGWSAIALGVGAGSIPWISMNIVGRKVSFFHKVDDVLGVVHTHLVASIVGGFGTGLYATKSGSAAFALTNPGGAIAGNGIQLGYQLAGACFVFGWNVVWTSLIMLFIKYVCRVPLRYSDEILMQGDYAMHGEDAYMFGNDHHRQLPGHHHDIEKGGADDGVILGKEPATAHTDKAGSSSSEGKADMIKSD